MKGCSCPYGPWVLWPMLVISAATTCTYYASFECTFFQVTNLFKHDVKLSYGLWTMEDYSGTKVIRQDVSLFVWHVGKANSCSLWSNHPELDKGDLDSAMKFARVVSLIACILGAMIWIWIMLASCRSYSPRAIRMACCSMLATALFQALSFWALKSSYCVDKSCKVDFAGWIGVAACILWLLAICAALRLKDPRADPQDNPLRRRPRRLFRRRRKPQPKAYPEEEEDEPSQDFQPDGYEYREYDPEDAPPPPEEEGALVPFSYGSPRDFVIDEGDEEEEEEEDKPRYRDNGHEQQAAPYSDNEPVVDPYDQDPFVNAGDYDNDHNARAVPEQDTDPRVYAGRDPDFAPGDKVYGSDDPNAVPGDRVFGADDPNALPGDRVYGGDDPFAVPREAVYGSDDPNALPGEKVYGSDDPRPVPGDRVFGSNDPNHVPHETVYGSDDPNHLPGERVYGRDDPNHLPRETVYGSDDPNASADAAPDLLSGEGVLVPVPPSNPFASFAAPPAAEKGHVERENPATPETAAPDLLSGQSVLVPVTPSNPFASLGALDGDGENDDDDDDDDDDDELNQANLYSNNVLKAPYVRPTSTAPDEAPRSRPSSRASSRASNQYDSGSRPSSRASNRERATPVTVGEWGLSFD